MPRQFALNLLVVSFASDNRDAYDAFATEKLWPQTSCALQKVLAGIKSALVASPFVPKSGAVYLREIRGVTLLLFFEIFIIKKVINISGVEREFH